MDFTRPLVLREDVLIIPVEELAEDVRSGIECSEHDFAVSRPTSRHPSSVIDAQAAALLQRFREPRTIVEAVILFSREYGLKTEEVLEDAYRLVRRFLENRFLRFAESNGEPAQEGLALTRDELFEDLRILRPLYMLEDTELYVVRDPKGRIAALKILRPQASHLRPLFDREAYILRCLSGRVAPQLLREGAVEERRYLLLEWCSGIDAFSAIGEWKGKWDLQSRIDKLRIAVAIARTYARLHELGVLHGDVHPRNLLVAGDQSVKIIDFGFSRLLSEADPELAEIPRGGIPFYFEPEYARSILDAEPPPHTTPAGEQYSLAALLYQSLTGFSYLDFNLEREQMLRQIVEDTPVSFAARELPEWPELEECLNRALDKDPTKRFPSTADLARGLEEVLDPLLRSPERPTHPVWTGEPLSAAAERVLASASLEGDWYESGLRPAPTASLNYGAAGIAYLLYRIACLREDPSLLATADAWAVRASAMDREDAFYNDEFELTRENIGEASPFHSRSGVFAVQALIAHAAGDVLGHVTALEHFVSSSQTGHKGLDLTLGRSGSLLAAALLLDTLPGKGAERVPLLEFGNTFLEELWVELRSLPPISRAGINYLGIAHGWAGFLYATLQWCRAADNPPPPQVESRLHELADLSEPQGRGLMWPWMLHTQGREAAYMSGWCNGTSGYVFLWTLAHRFFDKPLLLDLAHGAAWEVWDAPDLAASLCCGLVGRSYALLNFYRHTQETIWLERARDLAVRAVSQGQFEGTHPHSLYKGEISLAGLAADIEAPDYAAQPFFEEENWPTLGDVALGNGITGDAKPASSSASTP